MAADWPSLEHKLQFKAAELILQIKEIDNGTRKIIKDLMQGVGVLFGVFLDILKERFESKFRKDDALDVEEVHNEIDFFRDHSLFEGLLTNQNFENYINSHQGLVRPVKKVLKTSEVIRNGKVETVDVDYGYVVPFLPSLEKVLQCPEVLNCVDNPQTPKEGVITSPLDAFHYKNHPVVVKNKKNGVVTLGVGIYTDGVEMTDSASSKAGVHGITFVYWTLYNLYPELRSSNRATFLLACFPSTVVKKYGYGIILKDFVEAMKSLSSEAGVVFTIAEKMRTFFGIFLFSSGDNPASAELGGFKETSHFATKGCRQCETLTTDMYKHFEEGKFVLRTKARHAVQVGELEDFLANGGNENPSVKYGINSRSVLMDIPNCDVTKCLPQDLMHCVIEGTLKLEICCLVSHVLDKKALSLAVINQRIGMFSKYFGDKPSPIEVTHLEKKRLRQKASEALALAFILPFALRQKNKTTGKMESVCDAPNLECYILRLRLLDLEMASEVKLLDIQRIRDITREHHTKFQILYPDCMVPKHHFEVHMGTHILLHGPLRQQWCFRFEGKHSYFKRLLRIIRCQKNHVYSLSLRHQLKECGLMMLSKKGGMGPYIRRADFYGVSYPKQVKSLLIHKHSLKRTLGVTENDKVDMHRFAVVKGVRYRKRTAFIASFDEQNMPQFGEILAVYSKEGRVAFTYKQLTTDGYNDELNAFPVKYSSEVKTILASSLTYHHKLYFIKSVGAQYVVVPCKSFLL